MYHGKDFLPYKNIYLFHFVSRDIEQHYSISELIVSLYSLYRKQKKSQVECTAIFLKIDLQNLTTKQKKKMPKMINSSNLAKYEEFRLKT